jgi:predicted ester cyclase
MKKILLACSVSFILLSCGDRTNEDNASVSDSTEMKNTETKEERNKKVVKSSIEAMLAKDTSALMATLADNIIDYGDGTGNPLQNRDSLKSSIAMFLDAFPDYKGEDIMYFADGDHVVVIGEWSGTFKNDMGKIKATGKKFKIRDADIFRVNEEGKIAEHRVIMPMDEIFEQMGVKTNKK